MKRNEKRNKTIHGFLKKNRNGFLSFLRQATVLAGYIFFFAMAYWLAFAFRYDFDLGHTGMQNCYRSIVWIVMLKSAVFFFHRHFHNWGIYATFKDFQVLLKSAFFSSVGIFVATYYVVGLHLPRTVPVLDFIFTVTFIGIVRYTWRAVRREILPRLLNKNRKNVLIIGANEHGVLLAHELYNRPELGYKIVGFISTHERKVGRYIAQIPVLGHVEDLLHVLAACEINDVLLLQGVLNRDSMRNAINICQRKNVRLRIVPPMEARLGGSSLSIRDINIEDLLRRKQVILDDSIIENLLAGKKVLVTGAGGSIGSEICRQIVRFNPETLAILGRGENRIFFLEKELKQIGFQKNLIPVIADVTNESRMRQVFEEIRPDVVFHAAAHKHVPLMEANPGEAIRNNVLGTKIVSDLSEQFGVATFVLISTDKVVNPTSVMGASKHLAERYVHSLASKSKTKFVVTRFGNVLGSAGSVVPVFRQQILNGGPITITDFRMTRYFMTIPEAAQLVLQAAAMGDGGEIFVLDMGEPVRILDLAKDLIRLSGLSEDSIEIRETGMRPGEKLYEELYFDTEKAIPTSHPKLRCAYHRKFECGVVDAQIQDLLTWTNDTAKIQARLCELIEEYRPQTEIIPFSTKPDLSVFPRDSQDLRSTG